MEDQYNPPQEKSGYTEQDEALQKNIRVQTINSKLASIEVGIEEEKIAKSRIFDKTLLTLDSKITKSQFADDTKFKLLREQVTKLQEGITAERIIREEYEIQKSKELKNAEGGIGADLIINKQTEKESYNLNAKLEDESIFTLRLELAKGKKLREEKEGRALKEIAERLACIEADLDAEKRVREENAEKLIKKATEQITKINDAMEREKKLRDESQATMFRMIEDMNSKLMECLEQERKHSEEEEDVLIKLLEDTCTHVESKILKKSRIV